MALPRPEGHPGEDAGLKLALTRLLISNRVATKEQVDQAVAAEKSTRGLYVSHLLDTGVSGDKMLALLARAAGLPSAAGAWVRKPHADLAAAADGDACRALLAVPFRREGDALHIAFAAPLPKDLAAHLPPHVPHVALEADVRAGIERLYRSPDLPPPPPSAPGPAVTGLPPPPGAAAPLPSLDALPPLPSLDGLGAPPGIPGLPPLPTVEGLPPVPGLPPAPPPRATDVAAGVQPPGPAPSAPRGPRPQLPLGPHAQPELPGEVTVTSREILISQLKRLQWPAAGLLALVLGVKGVGCMIDRTRAEVDKRGDELARGMGVRPVSDLRGGQPPMGPPGEGPATVPTNAGAPEGAAAPSLPPPAGSSDAVSDAVLAVDQAARGSDVAAFVGACENLVGALSASGNDPHYSIVQHADLRNLFGEAAAFCNREHSSPSDPGWPPLRAKVMHVLAGDPPAGSAEPRYWLEAPPKYLAAKAALDEAIRAGDVSTACTRLSTVRNAIADWMEHMPGGMRLVRMNEVVNQDLEDFLMTCSRHTIDELREHWIRVQMKLEPNGN